MASTTANYVVPSDVTSPKRYWKLIKVLLHGTGENEEAPYDRQSVAVGMWKNEKELALRWNGYEGHRLGDPQSRGCATWYIVGQPFRKAVIASLPERQRVFAEDFFGEDI